MAWPKGVPRGPRPARPAVEEESVSVNEPTAPRAASPVIQLTADQLREILLSVKGDETARNEQLGQIMAQAREPMPENKTLPPDGKPDLRCPTLYCGMPVGKDVSTIEELTLFNRLEPGIYRVTKADNSRVDVTVTGERDEKGRITRLAVSMDTNGEKKHNWPPLDALLMQIVGQQVAAP